MSAQGEEMKGLEGGVEGGWRPFSLESLIL